MDFKVTTTVKKLSMDAAKYMGAMINAFFRTF